MHRLAPLIALLLMLGADIAAAQANSQVVPCDACRDPVEHPEDYVNHALNQIYGPDAWMTVEEADDFYIESPEALLVYVDVDFLFLGIDLLGLDLPLWPTNMLQFTLGLPNGEIYVAARSIFQAPLPVPANAYNEPPEPDEESSGDGADGGNDGVDEESGDEERDDDEWPEVERTGRVEIVDPDEDGNVPEWCEEC